MTRAISQCPHCKTRHMGECSDPVFRDQDGNLYHANANPLGAEIAEAEAKAIDSLARYKFAMFGYWAGIWVHLNRIEGNKRANPFSALVKTARDLQAQQQPLNLEDQQ